MDKKPLVSVVTPSYNQGEFLEDTIRSVLEQDYIPLEYFVIDGGSDDHSVQILEKYTDQIDYWESTPDLGQSHAINKGLKRAKGEILGWINSDDRLMPGTIRRVVDTFRSYPEIDVVYGRLERINAKGEKMPTPQLPKDRVTFNRQMVIGECVVNQPGSFWRRRMMEKVGDLDEKLHYALDYDYWIRMVMAGAQFKKLPGVVAQFRLSQGSKTVGQTKAMAEEQLSVLEGLLAKPDLGEILELGEDQIRGMKKNAYSHIGLHAFYGSIKHKAWREALEWLIFVFKNEPAIFLEQRWFDLGWASVKRRLMIRR